MEWQTIYVKKGGQGLANIEDSVYTSIQGLEDYIKKSKERPRTAASNSIDNIRINRTTITKKQKWEENQLDEYYKRWTGEISH